MITKAIIHAIHTHLAAHGYDTYHQPNHIDLTHAGTDLRLLIKDDALIIAFVMPQDPNRNIYCTELTNLRLEDPNFFDQLTTALDHQCTRLTKLRHDFGKLANITSKLRLQ